MTNEAILHVIILSASAYVLFGSIIMLVLGQAIYMHSRTQRTFGPPRKRPTPKSRPMAPRGKVLNEGRGTKPNHPQIKRLEEGTEGKYCTCGCDIYVDTICGTVCPTCNKQKNDG